MGCQLPCETWTTPMIMTSSLVMAPGPIRQRASRPWPCILDASCAPERQSRPQSIQKTGLTSMNLQTALATRFANFSTAIVLCAGVWSLVMIWLLHSLYPGH
jgi:hypothetical protein